jgi:hemolysin activation/secretion protein
LRSSLFTSALISGSLLWTSQAALAAPLVGAGGQLQQIPPTETPERSIPDIRIERSGPVNETTPAGPKVVVRTLHVTGQTLFPEAQLIAVTGFTPWSELDLHDLRQMAARIADFYNRRGYFVAQAYVPAQDIKDGAVTIAVVEGHYDKVVVKNRTNFSDRSVEQIMDGVTPGDPVAIAPLDRRLLLLSDVPGVIVSSTLSPGEAVGTSDLTVALTPGPRFSGSIDGDNAGDPNTGAYRLGGTLNINDPTGHGDLISLRALSSFDGLDYGRIAYQTLIRDATVGVAVSALDYRLHGAFSVLDASGTAEVASVFASYPVIRSYDNNLDVLGDFDARFYQDKIGAIGSVVDRDENAVLLGIAGDHHDALGGGGWDQYSLGYTFGDLDIRTPSARLLDLGTARSNGDYGKLSYSVSRLQTVVGPLSVYGLIRGQEASKNLDISEKMELGGAYAVRAYPEGLIYGDDGYLATLEARLMLPPPPERIPGRLQLFGFVDTGSATINHSPWLPGPNRETVSGAGVGGVWIAPNNFIVRVTYAHVLGDAIGVPGPVASSRVWVQLVKLF